MQGLMNFEEVEITLKDLTACATTDIKLITSSSSKLDFYVFVCLSAQIAVDVAVKHKAN